MIIGNGYVSPQPIVVPKPQDRYGVAIDKSYMVFEQSVPAEIWNINHDMGRIPTIEVIDNDGNVLTPDNIKLDLNTATVTFLSAQTGRAMIATVGGAYSDQNTILVNPQSIDGYPDGTIILRTS